MEKNRPLDNTIVFLLCAVYAAVNVLFVCKYVPRVGLSPMWLSMAWCALAAVVAVLWSRFGHRLPDTLVKWAAWGSLVLVSVAALAAFRIIDPMQINVDRWSATTYFIDALFRCEYPYGVHTHVCETNFPSPFPVWHYLMIPFRFCGDVGYGIIAFLWLAAVAVFMYCRSCRFLLFFMLMLVISPAFWWEIMTRSDGLSNAFLVFALILWMEKRIWTDPDTLGGRWWLVAVVAGLAACTRLSAVIPLAIYLFGRYVRSGVKTVLLFPLIAAVVAFIVFAPYIFWDTSTWVFFTRNPFMSQSSPGNPYILLFLVGVAVLLSLWRKDFALTLATIGIFLFAFMLVSMLGVIYASPEHITLFDIQCDISYFTLSFPFCIAAIWMLKEGDYQTINK